MAWTWHLILVLAIFAVRDFRKENARFYLRIERLFVLTRFLVIVSSRSWVLSGRELLVLDVDSWLKHFSSLL